eukprot:scaffold813_cov313-Prasinococcus_capsulatus_cf.AAC.8
MAIATCCSTSVVDGSTWTMMLRYSIAPGTCAPSHAPMLASVLSTSQLLEALQTVEGGLHVCLVLQRHEGERHHKQREGHARVGAGGRLHQGLEQVQAVHLIVDQEGGGGAVRGLQRARVEARRVRAVHLRFAKLLTARVDQQLTVLHRGHLHPRHIERL